METQVLVFSGGLFNDVVVAHCACAWLYIGWCILENVYKSQKGSRLSEIIPRPVTIHWNIKPGYMCHFHHKLSNNIWSNFNVVVVFFGVHCLLLNEWQYIARGACDQNRSKKQLFHWNWAYNAKKRRLVQILWLKMWHGHCYKNSITNPAVTIDNNTHGSHVTTKPKME